MDYLKSFLIGGAICLVGQLLIDKTKLTPARILVLALLILVLLVLLVLIAVLLVLHSVCSSLLRLWPRG